MLKTKAQNTGKDESHNKQRRAVAQILCEYGNLNKKGKVEKENIHKLF